MNKCSYLFGVSIVVSGLCAHAQLPAGAVAPAQPVAPAAGAAALPAAAPVHHSLSMEVKAVGSGGTGKATYHGFQNTTLQGHRTVLEIDVRNFSHDPDQIHVEWYFFAAGLGSTKDYIFDSGNSDVMLRAGGEQKVSAASKELRTSVSKSVTVAHNTTGGVDVTSATRSEEGSTVKGWLVRLVADGKVIQLAASGSKYEDLGRHDADLQALKSQMQGQKKMPGQP